MTIKTDVNASASEVALRLAELVRSRQQLEASGGDLSALDQQLTSYKTVYVRAGSIYGGNTVGMLRWFDERAQEAHGSKPPRANHITGTPGRAEASPAPQMPSN